MHILLWYSQPYHAHDMQVFEMIYWHRPRSRICILLPWILVAYQSKQLLLYINRGTVVMGIMMITLLTNQSSCSSEFKNVPLATVLNSALSKT